MGAKTNCPTVEQVRARAYQLYEARGRQPGHETDDWLQAEYELMRLPIHKIAELRPPGPRKKNVARPALVSLVQAALLVGVEAIPHVK
jgi:hypothetical protein